MNCENVRENLPLLIYGDLNADEARLATDHLAQCPPCRDERDALLATKQALDSAPVAKVAVDLSAIHAQALAMQARSARRWKRFTIAAGALAASLLAILLIRPEVSIGDGQFAIRWAAPADAPRTVERVTTIVQAPQAVRDTELEERVRVLTDLVKVLNLQMETADQKRREELEVLITRVDLLRIQSQQRWDETNRDVTALYTAQFRGERR